MFICDSQVHAPDTPHLGDTSGIDGADLTREMDSAGVQGCVLVPLEAPGADRSANNGKSERLAARYPGRFVVMGRVDVSAPELAEMLPTWLDRPYMRGIRLALHREPARSMFDDDALDWFWAASEKLALPIMVLAHHRVDKVARVAKRYPRLRLALDHAGLAPHRHYERFDDVLAPVLALASFPNVSVKASAMPCATGEHYPFPSLQAPIRWLVDAFGPERVFWGSDLSRLPCSYSDCVRLFTDQLDFLAVSEREAILGGSVMRWLRWAVESPKMNPERA